MPELLSIPYAQAGCTLQEALWCGRIMPRAQGEFDTRTLNNAGFSTITVAELALLSVSIGASHYKKKSNEKE